MKSVAISELKTSLSEYLTQVRAGEEVVVTDRGVPVARMVPLQMDVDADALVADLIRTGQARPSETPPPSGFLDRRAPSDPSGQVLKLLLQERETSW